MNSLYLASGSPRRRELLAQIGVPFTLVSALTGNRQPTLALVLPALVSALLWPWISFGLRGLSRRYKIN